jgi:hypothetical protein
MEEIFNVFGIIKYYGSIIILSTALLFCLRLTLAWIMINWSLLKLKYWEKIKIHTPILMMLVFCNIKLISEIRKYI